MAFRRYAALTRAALDRAIEDNQRAGREAREAGDAAKASECAKRNEELQMERSDRIAREIAARPRPPGFFWPEGQ